jgi:putative transcriptional regulator
MMSEMGQTPTDLVPPLLLVAMPQVLDPFFHRSVVLLLHHTDEGSFGLIINRETAVTVAETLQGLKVTWGGNDELPAFFGGPVQPQVGTVLFGTENIDQVSPTLEESGFQIGSNLWMSQNIKDLEQLASSPPERFRLFLGYAGWGADQLVDEITRNDWLTAAVDEEILFCSETAQTWQAGVRLVGIDPASLPSWTEDQGGNAAN